MGTINRFSRRVTAGLLLLSLVISGCAIVPAPTRSARVGDGGELGACADLFASLDRSVARARVGDSGAFRVEGFPYLRVNRFLASFREKGIEPEAFSAWIDRMLALDREARRFEVANLPEAKAAAAGPGERRKGVEAMIAACGDRMRAADFAEADRRAALRAGLSVPDEYLTHWKIVGIYPFTRLFVSSGVSRWHAAARHNFSTDPPAGWGSTRYVPETVHDRSSVAVAIAESPRDALGIPEYSAQARVALFRAHAPIWQIQTEGEFDRIGAPAWDAEGRLTVDTTRPQVYTLLSFTRFEGEVLTQLNYIIWLPSRPKAHALDIYGGFLDGVTFRVTLGTDGEPQLYETVHNCGCYYAAYPTHRLRVREKIDLAEPPLILMAPQRDAASNCLAVAVESHTHFVRHLFPLACSAPKDAATYRLADYNELRSLGLPCGGRRSMFGPDGLVAGSERLERFILWPTGVVSPGAMRQSGRHAVAFVGKRHFDDPFALEA
ncbi:MAG: hypothetical protein EHM15_06560, partial [Desulfobacteraceae bacterium]